MIDVVCINESEDSRTKDFFELLLTTLLKAYEGKRVKRVKNSGVFTNEYYKTGQKENEFYSDIFNRDENFVYNDYDIKFTTIESDFKETKKFLDTINEKKILDGCIYIIEPTTNTIIFKTSDLNSFEDLINKIIEECVKWRKL